MSRRELGPAALQVARAVAAGLTDDAGPVIVACSGGADSLALAAGCAWAARRLPVVPLVVVVDHGLQAGSGDVAGRAAGQCAALGLEARVVEVEVDAAHPDGPEAGAREARYAALEAAGAGPILLGHTLDDQAETVLLGLARGSGTRSLAGMSPRAGRRVRPLLGLRRDVTRRACVEWGLDPWQDPHNVDLRFARVRARERALPALEATLGPGIAAALARTADLARDDADLLDALAADVPLAAEPPVAPLATLPPALRRRVLRRWLASAGLGAEFDHVVAVDALLLDWRGQGPLDLPGGSVARVDARLVARVDARS